MPCNTPGAAVAEPVDPQAVAPGAANALPTCVLAISDATYGRGYSPYYPGGYYRRPYYGSIGVGIGLGSIHHHDFGGAISGADMAEAMEGTIDAPVVASAG